MKIRFLGHASFLMDDGKCRLLTDPYLSGNPDAAMRPDEVETDFIFVSHGHGDHVGDTEPIAKRCGAVILSNVDLLRPLFEGKGLKTMGGNFGGRIELPFGSIKIVSAMHGSGVAGALACGAVIEMGGKKIYFAGDTALMADMMLLKDEEIDLALLPIGDFYTMGPEDAVRACRLICPKLVVPMHFNTFPPISQDPERFRSMCREAGFDCRVLAIGEEMEL